MKLCFFNRSYHPDQTATGQLLTELCEDLVDRHGCRVSVVTGWTDSTGKDAAGFVRRETVQGVSILRARGTRFNRRSLFGRVSNYLSYFFSALVASFRIRRSDVDVVVSLTDPPVIGLVGWLTARRCGARFVFVCQDVFPEVAELLTDFRNPLVSGLLQRINCFLISSADRVVVLGECMRQRLIDGKKGDPDKISIIPNWADSQAIYPLTKDNPFAHALGVDDRFVVMHSGNMGLSQELDKLLDVAERLQDIPEIIFLLVGDGVRRHALELDARRRGLDNVRFVDYQPKERLSESFSTADLFVITLERGLSGYIVPSKLYGILAAGRGFVAAIDSDSEVARVCADYNCGSVVAPGDAIAMEGEIRALFAEPDRVRAMGANARRAGERFDRRRQVSSYRNLFAELIEQPWGSERTAHVSAQTEL